VLQVMIGLVVGQIIVWGCGASSRVPARWKIRGCEVGRVDAEQHGGLAEGGSPLRYTPGGSWDPRRARALCHGSPLSPASITKAWWGSVKIGSWKG